MANRCSVKLLKIIWNHFLLKQRQRNNKTNNGFLLPQWLLHPKSCFERFFYCSFYIAVKKTRLRVNGWLLLNSIFGFSSKIISFNEMQLCKTFYKHPRLQKMHFATKLTNKRETFCQQILVEFKWKRILMIFSFISLVEVMIREVHLGIRGNPNIVKREKCNRENVLERKGDIFPIYLTPMTKCVGGLLRAKWKKNEANIE